MPTEYISLFSGFVGAIIGAGASLASVYLQQRTQQKRDRARFALDAALKEFEAAERYAEFMARNNQPITTRDLAYYIFLHTTLADHLFSGKTIAKQDWERAHLAAKEISEAGNALYERNTK